MENQENFDKWYTEGMNKDNTVHFADIVGAGVFYGRDIQLEEKGPLARLEKVILEQAKTSMLAGEPIGFARLCSLAYRGKTNQALKEIEKRTRLPKGYSGRGALCNNDSAYFYEGYETWKRFPIKESLGIETESPTGECASHPLSYIDTCLFGAKMAELNANWKKVKLFYERTKKIIDDRLPYTDYKMAYQERADYLEKMIEATKRLQEAKAFDAIGNLLEKFLEG